MVASATVVVTKDGLQGECDRLRRRVAELEHRPPAFSGADDLGDAPERLAAAVAEGHARLVRTARALTRVDEAHLDAEAKHCIREAKAACVGDVPLPGYLGPGPVRAVLELPTRLDAEASLRANLERDDNPVTQW